MNQTSKPGTQNTTCYPLATPPNPKSLKAHLLLKWTQGRSMEGYTAQLLLLQGLYLGFLGTLQPLDETQFIALMLTENRHFNFALLSGSPVHKLQFCPVCPSSSFYSLVVGSGYRAASSA